MDAVDRGGELPGFGVDGSDNDNITVVNGTVRGMGVSGVVLAGENCRVEHVRAVSNGGTGIAAFAAAPNKVSGNTVNSNIAVKNGLDGILVGSGSTVTGNIVQSNLRHGILSGMGSTVSGNTARSNGGSGLSLGMETGYTRNVLSNNTQNVAGGVSLGQNLCDGVVC